MEPTPSEPDQSAAAEAQLLVWTALRDQMQTLHAELEFLRLMIALGVRTP